MADTETRVTCPREPAPWAAAAAIAAAGLLAYHNSFGVPFFFDDRAQINDNPTIRHLWPLTAVLSPPADAGVGGRPLLNLSFAVNYALGGMNPWGYHALNLAIHILAALTLFGILRRLCPQGPSSDRTRVSGFSLRQGSGQGFQVSAFVIALLWAVHPVQTEAVTYVAERAEEQMGLFYLLTVYCFLRYAEQHSDRLQVSGLRSQPSVPASSFHRPSPRSLWAVLSVLACLLGVMTKEVVVTAPVVVLLLDRTFLSGGFAAALRRHGRVYAGFAAAWAALACDMVLTDVHRRGVGLGLGGSWWSYALTESRALTGYLGLSVWPHPLVFDRGMGVGRPGWEVLPFVVLILALVRAPRSRAPRSARASPAPGSSSSWLPPPASSPWPASPWLTTGFTSRLPR
jgi:protein O-mannosyl-transferase